MANYVLDENGDAVLETDIIKWARWFEKAKRHIGKTDVGPLRVSTVFIAIDHNFGEPGPPILWETMVFGEGMEDTDETQERYTSRAEAVLGHEKMVRKTKALLAEKAAGKE